MTESEAPTFHVFVVRAVDKGLPAYSVPGIYDELQAGRARIGWSYTDDLDLRKIQVKINGGVGLNDDEKGATRCLGFFERVHKEDYLIYPHQPSYGRFVVVKVVEEEYRYSATSDLPSIFQGDFRSYRACKVVPPGSIDWHDHIVPSQLRYRLYRPGRFSEMYDLEPFKVFMRDIPSAGHKEEGNEHRFQRIFAGVVKREAIPTLIRQEFTQHDFSRLFCRDLFERMGYSAEVREGASERGSDLIVTLTDPLIDTEFRIGIQAFAWDGTVQSTLLNDKLVQLVGGWQANELDYGVLLTTGHCGEAGRLLIKKHNLEQGQRPVRLIDAPVLTDLFVQHFVFVTPPALTD